jgi:hypothetical protein
VRFYSVRDLGGETPDAESRIKKWSVDDVITLYESGDIKNTLESMIRARQPSHLRTSVWEKYCYNYLLESYIYWRRNVEVVNLEICRINAYRDLFERMYSFNAPNVKTSIMRERGW